MKIRLTLFVLFSTLSVYSQTEAIDYQNIEFKSITSKHGLSQMTVLDIIQDDQGYMWFATREGINRFDGNRVEQFMNLIDDPTSISSNYATSFALDKDKQLWIGTQYGVNRYIAKKELFERYSFDDEVERSLYKNRIRRILCDSKKRLWMATRAGLAYFDYDRDKLIECREVPFPIFSICEFEGSLLIGREPHGLYRYFPETKQLINLSIGAELQKTAIRAIHYSKDKEVYLGTNDLGLWRLDKDFRTFYSYKNQKHDTNSLANNSVRSIVEDKNKNIIVGTFDGISVLTPHRNELITIKNETRGEKVFSHFSLHSLYIDKEETLWIGTWAGGVNYGNTEWREKTIRVLNPYPQKNQQGVIGALCPDGNKGLWIGIEGSGLSYYEFSSRQFKHYKLPDIDNNKLRNKIISAIVREGNNLYVGTNIGLICCLDSRTGSVKNTYRVPEDKAIVSLCVVGDGSFLVGLNEERGLLLYTANGEITTEFFDSDGKALDFEFVRGVLRLGEGEFAILSNKYELYRYNIISHEYTFFDLKKHTKSRNDGINCFYKDSRSLLWLGTSEKGLYCIDMAGNLVARYLYPNELPFNTVNGITEDKQGNIWFSQLNNLIKLEVENKKVRNYWSIDINEFSVRSANFANNNVYFGSDKGLVEFDPNKISNNSAINSLVINRLQINNQRIYASKTNFHEGEFQLKYNQNNIAIEYAALEYFRPQEILYAYKLEGLEKEWNYVSNRQIAYYTNISAGNYSFRLKASNGNGVWIEMTNPMKFEISPPFWLSIWAYMIYTMLVIIAVVVFIYYAQKQIRLRNDLIVQKTQQKNLEKLHEDRINLFTNLSHELRTPLSLIVSPLDEILANETLSTPLLESLSMIQRNSRRLLYIANELLDFRKKESGSIALRVAPGDFSLFIYEIIISFSQVAKQRNITFDYKGKDDGIHLWYDRSWMEKVLFNLFSNALKNTPEGGYIELSSCIEKAHYKLMIMDSGHGIPAYQLESIFEPFYQIREDNTSIYSGTGIGLSLVKGVVELHHGTIIAGNNKDVGACFTMELPLGKSHFSESQTIDNYKSSEEITNYPAFDDAQLEIEIPVITSVKREVVLIVEDNRDVCEYLRRILERKYNVLIASNGSDGYIAAMNYLPDLVISDVMMPKMNGVELCKRLKDGVKTAHIPIILLTARASMGHIDEGLAIGADDYITKPFDPKMLIRRINNLLLNRARLKSVYGKTFGNDLIHQTISNVEEDFLNRLYKAIETEISNPEYGAEQLGRQLGMSKTSLYNKTKDLTKLAPSNLIRKMRMELSKTLFEEGVRNIMDVAMKTGHSTPSYFASSFKSYYGLTPSEYIKTISSQSDLSNKTEKIFRINK